MKTRSLIALLFLAAPLAQPLRAQAIAVDTSGTGAVLDQALNHSAVMQNLAYLSDMIGPRLTGSAAMKKANDWTMDRFKAYGLSSQLESYVFGVTWERGSASLKLVQPFSRAITAHSWAWTAGTGGKTLTGEVIRINGTPGDSLDAYLPKVKGKWLMLSDPSFIWNPDGPPMTAADSQAMKDAQAKRMANFQRLQNDPKAMQEFRQASYDRAYRLKAAGALGILTDGSKEFGLVTMSGSPNSVSPLPNLVVSHEDYALLNRLIQRGNPPVLAGNVTNTLGGKPVEQYNTIGEIKGSEKPDEVVILGAHLDSWDLGTGVTDNGTGSMVVLEAARAIAQSGVKPKRTIRFILFSGEEQGLLGSTAYAAQHAAEADRIQAVLVLDNGTGMITGQALQGRKEFEQLWIDLLAPVTSLGAKTVRDANKGGTDHLSFIPYGVPGFNFDQETRGYNHTHHSQVDTYDHAVPADLIQASAVMAVTALELANLQDLLARGEKKDVTPPAPMKPSPGVAMK
jgi:carboxypeptidase Q